MLFNKSSLATVLIAAIVSVTAAPSTIIFIGTATHFNASNLPADFTPCGGNCPPRTPFTLPIALPLTLFEGSDSCCSTFTITYEEQTVRGTYAFKSSNLANMTNLVLDNDLFANFADPNVVTAISLVTYHL